MAARYRTDVKAGIVAGLVGLVWLSAIWYVLVFPPAVARGVGEPLTGTEFDLDLHEWGFGDVELGGPPIIVAPGAEVTFVLTNSGINFHSFAVVRDGGEHLFGFTEDDVIDPGQLQEISFTVDLDEGEYVYICPVKGHRDRGMEGPFLVQAGGPASVVIAGH